MAEFMMVPDRPPSKSKKSAAASSASDSPRNGRITTFDVFETLIVRSVSPHQEIFDRVGRSAHRHGLIACSAFAFSRVREASEARALGVHGDSMTLSHIYVEVADALTLTRSTADRILNLELEEEARSLRPVESARPLLSRVRETEGRVSFISDMYLPADFIRDQLHKHGLWQSGDSLYVSHHHECTKGSGRLFEIVALAEGVSTKAITHYGNNHWIDVAGAEKAGATGKLISAGNPNRYEVAMETHRHATDGRSAIMAGASRLARTAARSASSIEHAVVEVSAGVVAPVLTSYVLWILRQAEVRGLRRLYFVSRDGEILIEIARSLAPRLGLNVELKYLYGSRLAWNPLVSSPTRNPDVWFSMMWFSSRGFTNRELLERAGLTLSEVDDVVSASTEKAWTSTSDRRIVHETLDRLEADGTLRRCSDRNKEVVVRYLEQEGLFDGTPHAFVDIGWRGTQHDALIELQLEKQVPPAYGLFFGLEQTRSTHGDIRSAYFFDARLPDREKALASPLSADTTIPSAKGHHYPGELQPLFEMFCAGREGTLVGYRQDGDQIIPVIEPDRKAEVAGWGLDKVYETVVAFASNLELDHATVMHADVRPALAELINLFWTSPTPLEAEAWGTFPWELGEGSTRSCIDFAPPFSMAFALRKAGLYPKLETQWPAASRMRSSQPIRAAETAWNIARRAKRSVGAGKRIVSKARAKAMRSLARSKAIP